ncbi:MAG: SDR family NAD(P)-dependent oxidoreductase [Ignavibacterium sp.]|nr:MAG: SDR family NAD(P)-dependent oxidoreductase [Ignavibacterium sp.]
MRDLKHRTVFVTGASSGIGKACATLFAEAGANILLAARRIEKVNKLSEELRKQYKIKTKEIKLDVRNYDEVTKTLSLIDDQWKQIDILINNAGLARGFDKIHEGKVEDWDEMIDTNIKGLLFVTRRVLPLMVERKSGHIINIGSIAGHETYPSGNVYAATKFAVNALSKSIRMDALDKGIKVTSIDPGLVETEFSLVRFSGDEKQAKSVYNGLTPLTANDIAETVLFCATRPENVNINEMIITPLAQASTAHYYRKS